MPLTLSTAMQVEKNKQQSTNAFTWLFEVQITGAPSAYRLAMYDQPIVFHGLTFAPTVVQMDSQEDATHAALVNLRATFENVSQEMIALFENYWVSVASPDWRVLQWQIFCNMPDEMPYGNANVYSVQQANHNDITAVADLVLEGITLSALIPKFRYVASAGFPNIPRRG